MTSESNRLAGASTSYVETVCRSWGWSWQPVDQIDDDGLDGLVYLRAKRVNEDKPIDRRSWKHEFTGGLIQVQIKSGDSYIVDSCDDYLEIKISSIEEKRELWNKYPLPVSLIYVKSAPQGKIACQAWWADLKHPDTYTERGTIKVSLKNRFQPGLECRKPFSRLATGQHRMLGLTEVDMTKPWDLPLRISLSKAPKHAAIEFYKHWKGVGAKHSSLGDIIINRTGWSHITRVKRPVSRIFASFDLLPAAAKIISTVNSWHRLRQGAEIRQLSKKSWAQYDYLGISAIVKWPAKEPSEVKVILRRETTFIEDLNEEHRVKVLSTKTWFYSVYEPARRKSKL
ncbi:DUF4365 domain-containing protein [Pseudomonas putida]|uniref:DUF4365 domain-containing protein n=1 Tax=Pseudomonas putida TaxID=303 RepID=UPI001F5161EA|nr:DUF4365 domain-containing protein [Pseudomonas putida]